MCRIGFVRFSKKTTIAERKKILKTVLTNSWELGNKHGAGIFSFGDDKKRTLIKDVRLEDVIKKIDNMNDVYKNNIIHTRFATNEINYTNTQPLSYNGIVVAHNGVCHTDQTLDCKTTNDSENILRLYEKFRNVKDVNNNLSGSFNYILYDMNANKLIFNADSHSYKMWNVDWNIYIVQETEQLDGILETKLFNPKIIGTDKLNEDEYFEINLNKKADDLKHIKKYTYTRKDREGLLFTAKELTQVGLNDFSKDDELDIEEDDEE
jgi:hypothetical protein